MKCPSCGAAKLVRDTRDIPYTYKGERTTIPAVRGDYCPACGESVLTAQESVRVSSAMLDFAKQVNASRRPRVYRPGPRYENGRTKPPLALVKLLRLLDHHPDLLDEVIASH
ncbi:MAG: YgiT-type zinc finger protein [Acidobacteria bacterium]|nr:YgiT-type zinc finger protein [Acidobacteriota bacterium]